MATLTRFDWSFPNGNQETTGAVVLDASVNETHTITAQITEHQVETGVNSTDHIRVLPRHISIEGLITDTPLDVPDTQADGVVAGENITRITLDGGKQVTVSSLLFSSQFFRVLDAYDALVEAISNGAVFKITTSLHTYENMACSSMPVTRNAGSGNSLQFTIEFTELRFVSTVEIETPAKKQSPAKKGKQSTKEAKPKEKETAEGLLHKLTGTVTL